MAYVNQKERAARAWPKLTEIAANRQSTTYKELGDHIGIHHRTVRFVLSEIQDYCLSEKLPPITILVIGQGGVPGSGFIAWDVDDLDRGLELVYSYPWGDLENPFAFATDGSTVESMGEAVFRHRITPKDAYGRIKVRGMAQLVFREALIKAYGGQCALSDVYSRELLEASHIIPWARALPEQRINPNNGILLSTIHHRFFDLGWIHIKPDYSIKTDSSCTRNGSFERYLLEELNGSRLRLPSDERHWPDPEFIRQRNELT